MSAIGLEDLRALLLRDRDEDGFPDALCAPVWIATGAGTGDIDAAVAAAAELLVPLAERALVLDVDTRTWDAPVCGFAIAAQPPAAPDHTGVAITRGEASLSVSAPNAKALMDAVLALVGRGGHAAHGGSRAQTVRQGLGALLHGDDGAVGATPFSGSRDHPERLSAGVAPGGGVVEALGVVLRFALAGRDTPGRVCADPSDAALRTRIDPRLPVGSWQLRRRRCAAYRVELVGHDAASLADACRWFATRPIATPDGQRLDDLEDALTQLVRAVSREGRLAALGHLVSEQRSRSTALRAALLPAPPPQASARLGLPVRNSARDGARRTWRHSSDWEGERLLAAADQLMREHATGASAVVPALQLEAFASESLALRHELHTELCALVAAAGVAIDVVPVRHAFRPALHWLLEEIVPQAPASAVRLHVAVGRQPERFGPADRWLRELYPMAELAALQRPDVTVTLELLAHDVDAPSYEVTLYDAAGEPLARHALTPIVAEALHPAGGSALLTSGGVRLVRSGIVAAQVPIATDAEVFWRWFNEVVLPELTAALDMTREPLLHEIAVVASLSEPDDTLAIDHETDSMIEVLHEEVYFGVLEACERASGATRQRLLSAGRVLPFFRVSPRAPLRARVTVRPAGSGRLGVVTTSGAVIPAPPNGARAIVEALDGRGARVTGLTVELLGAGDEGEVARERLLWSATQPGAPLPSGVEVRLRSGETAPGGLHTLRSRAPLPEPPSTLPKRPLHPYEVVRYARARAAQHTALRVATPRETMLGQPLVVVELSDPERPALSRSRAAAWRPTVLVSARQHGNEATSTQSVLAWLEVWLRDRGLHRRANLVLHPLENPDGARLHAAFCSLAPNHMHHAARYTAFGADLQTNPRVEGQVIAESLMRHDAARRWRPVAHLNDHGYPAHAWIRSLSGFIPRGFANWSLPTGHLTILTTHGTDVSVAEALQERLITAVEATLTADAGIHLHTRDQVERCLRYRPAAATPFTYRSGLPFWCEHRPVSSEAAAAAPQVADGPDRTTALQALTPLVTLITEVPDETVNGEHWARCVRTHERVDDAVARTLLDVLAER